MRSVVVGVVGLTVLARAVASAAVVAAGPEFQVNTYTTGTQYAYRHAVCASDAGDFVVVWYSVGPDGDGHGISAQRYDRNGVPQGGEFVVNEYTTGVQRGANVACDADGNFVVLWRGDQDPGVGVFGRRFDSTGVPRGSEFRVNTYTTGAQYRTMAAVGPTGDFVVVWASAGQDGDDQGIFAQRYTSAGTTTGGEFLVNTYTTDAQRVPVVAVGPEGDFVVVWSGEVDGTHEDVFARRFASAGAPAGTEFRVNAYTSGAQRVPAVAYGAGGFVVTWESAGQDGSDSAAMAARFASDGTAIGTEFQVNTYTTDRQFYPWPAMDAAGNFVIAWAGYLQDDPGGGVFARHYDADGLPVGTEFRVNSYTTGNQSTYVAIDSDKDGDFVVVWGSDGQVPGGGYDVFAQRF